MIVELFLGGITHHFIAPNLNYCNVIGKRTGTIKHSYGAVLVGDKKSRYGLMKGQDSVCAPITGILSSHRISDNLNFVLGGYNTNKKAFADRQISPPSVFGVTPVVGFRHQLPLYKSKNMDLSLDTTISVGIITHGISVRFGNN